jgi:putative Mn2+ efflux pump MntP
MSPSLTQFNQSLRPRYEDVAPPWIGAVLGAVLQPLRNDMADLKNDVTTLKENVTNQINTLKEQLNGMATTLGRLETGFEITEGRLSRLERLAAIVCASTITNLLYIVIADLIVS